LLRVTDPGGSVACDTDFPEWDQLLQDNGVGITNHGRMRARSELEEPSPDPLCVLPPSAGYRRLENQLYRVEVHQGGNRAQATFKWSRDNGTVASRIEPDENGTVVSGTEIRVTEMGRDGVLTFASDPLPAWLELTDDRYELLNQRGTLAAVQSVDVATDTITFAAGTLPSLDADEHPVVRRWDQSGTDAGATGVPMTGDWQMLEDGVEVRFDEGVYRTGDFWLVPARTAIGFGTGQVEWPQEGGLPAARRADGTRHHFARLALVRLNNGTFSLVENGDCRRRFPPLTGIAASDVSFSNATCNLGDSGTVQQALDVLCQRQGSICTLLLGPGDSLPAAVAQLGGAQDAMICLRAGTYTLNSPLRIQDRGHVQIVGVGPGTRIEAPTSEIALRFDRCAGVTVENLSVRAGTAGHSGQDVNQLNGALTFVDCGAATVRSARVACSGGPFRGATCVTVRNAPALPDTTARIESSELLVGHLQTGVLPINVDRSTVMGNLVRGAGRPPDQVLVADAQYRGLLRRHLISSVSRAGVRPDASSAAPSAFAVPGEERSTTMFAAMAASTG
jgi:hypothetical protein